MICGYVRGGRQCGRPAVAVVRQAVDTHIGTGKGYRLCLDHVRFSLDPRPGLVTIIEWLDR